MNNNIYNKAEKLKKDLIEKSWADTKYKNELVKNPKKLINEIAEEKLNLDVKIIVEDQTDSSYLYLNIPQRSSLSNLDDLKLSDEQLELVSGGEFGATFAVGVALFGLFYAAAN